MPPDLVQDAKAALAKVSSVITKLVNDNGALRASDAKKQKDLEEIAALIRNLPSGE
jgi:hypothetical protein